MAVEHTDVLIVGSGGAGLVAACVAADAGLTVTVLERSSSFGGTTAISGGMLWIGNNGRSGELGVADSRNDTLTYLDAITRSQVPRALLEPLVDTGPELVRYLERETPVELSPIGRPDYHAHFPGGRPGGRVLDNQPFDPAPVAGLDVLLRRGTHFPPLTYAERHARRWPGQIDSELVAKRRAAGIRTLGGALAGGLLAAALERGVRLVSGVRACEVVLERGRAVGAQCLAGEERQTWRAQRAVVLSTGGFEWNEQMRRSFLRGPAVTAVSPPWNVGDGLRMAMRAGAALGNMSEGWWGPTYQIPGETYDGHPMTRHIVNELSLPGSILVNRSGRRFVNESMNYNDLSKTFHVFDPGRYQYVNTPAWLVFDARYQQSYATLTVPAGDPAPAWFHPSDSLRELAGRIGVDAEGLTETVTDFNRHAAAGVDPQFHRGERALDLYYGDERHGPSPCLGPIDQAPFHAVEVLPGLLGTKGGAQTDANGRVVNHAGGIIEGLYACGNAAASAMGLGYPGAGGSLGPQLVFGLRCGRAIAPT